jgi:hypothetical protein
MVHPKDMRPLINATGDLSSSDKTGHGPLAEDEERPSGGAFMEEDGNLGESPEERPQRAAKEEMPAIAAEPIACRHREVTHVKMACRSAKERTVRTTIDMKRPWYYSA